MALHIARVDKEPNAPFSLRADFKQVIKVVGITVVGSFQLNEKFRSVSILTEY